MSTNRQIDVDFVNFIAEEVKNVKSPMNLSQLCREFKKKSGITYSRKIFQRIRGEMSEMENFDIDTRVKMIFALGAPVSNGFLIELKKQADIELDEHHRIIKYKKHGNGLQLSGIHDGRPCGQGKQIMKFLAEKSENATSPIPDTAFLKEFNSSEGNSRVEGYIYTRYNLIKQQIYMTPEFDQQTRIKMMFVSNTKIHANILEELRQNAVVEVDEHQRITKYEANDGSLKLKGDRTKLRAPQGVLTEWSKEEREKLLSFVAEKSKQTKTPLFIQPLCREFIEKNRVSRTQGAVELNLYKHLLPKISKLDNFDMETKVRMLFALSVPVDQEFLNKLRKKAVVEVDEHQRITKYDANNGRLKLEAERKKLRTKIKRFTLWPKEETDKLWNHIVEKSNKTNAPLLIKPLCREFAEKNTMSRTMDAVRKNICKNVIPKISKQDDADMETKIRMIFALSVPVEEEFLNKLRKKAVVEIDGKRRITKYKANDGSLKLDGDHSKSAKFKRMHAQKESQSVNFKPSEIDDETEDYDDEEDLEEDVDEISIPNTRSGKLSKRRYPEVDSFCDSDDDESESSGSIKKTKTEKITKRTTSQTQKGRNSRNAYFSESDEEPEDEESEEEYEEEKKEFKANSSTRRSEKISKKRYPDNDSTCDFDDVSFDYPQNVSDSRIEKETEKLVEVPSNSSSEAPLVKNHKRKILENPSDSTSSSSKTPNCTRVSATQKDAESSQIVSGTNKNKDEVEYDGTGGKLYPDELPIKENPLLHKEVKLEDDEYKPDLSFLCGTTQNNMQNFSGTEVNHTSDVDQSTENTEEMTSGKDFMKLLRGLVDTLDSPILAELQSKIEKAIEKLGDGDHKIPIDDISVALNLGLIILNKTSTLASPKEESKSLRDFLLILRSTLSTFRSSSLNAFQGKIKENIKKLDSQDKIIPVESIRPVLETVLLLAMP